MTENYYIISGFLEPKPGKEEILADVLSSLIQPSLQEEGCIQYVLHRSATNPCFFMFYEVWINEEAFKAHSISPHIRVWKSKKEELLAKPNDILVWSFLHSHSP